MRSVRNKMRSVRNKNLKSATPRSRIGLTPRGLEFMAAKGLAFREKWMKKMDKGVTSDELIEFNKLCDEFHKPLDVAE